MRIGITCGDLVFLDDIRIFSNGHHLQGDASYQDRN